MKGLRNCAILLLAGLVLCTAQDGPAPHPVPPATTTTTTTTTAEPTPVPTTTTTTPSTSTSTSTTEPPHTTTTGAPTTTAAPTTTSTAAPPKPTPVPEPEVGSWTWTNATNNQTCVLTQMALQLNLTYLDAADKPTNVLYDVPKEARVVNGSCLTDAQFIQLVWGPSTVSEPNQLTISFSLNQTIHEFALSGVRFFLTFDAVQFPNAKANQTATLVNQQTLFETPMDMSYHCNRAQQLNLTTADAQGFNGTVTISKLQFEAFHNKRNDKKFSIAKDCDAIDTPDIVPIAVGCALILLIVIVLIAYLAGRRSTRSRGYLSM